MQNCLNWGRMERARAGKGNCWFKFVDVACGAVGVENTNTTVLHMSEDLLGVGEPPVVHTSPFTLINQTNDVNRNTCFLDGPNSERMAVTDKHRGQRWERRETEGRRY